MLRRRRPLLRAAAVAGAGYIAGKKMGDAGNADQEMAVADQQPAAPVPAQDQTAGISEGSIERLKQLATLRDQGVLTEDEFNAEKQKVLDGA